MPLLIHGFKSTSNSQEIALKFMTQEGNFANILFKINILDEDLNNENICSIKKFAQFKEEEEFLLNINTFLEIDEFQYINENEMSYYILHCKFILREGIITKLSILFLRLLNLAYITFIKVITI